MTAVPATSCPTCPRCGVVLPSYGSHMCQPYAYAPTYPLHYGWGYQSNWCAGCVALAVEDRTLLGQEVTAETLVGALWVCGKHIDWALSHPLNRAPGPAHNDTRVHS